MTERKAWKVLKKKEFRMIKKMLDAGLTIAQAVEVSGRSWQTVATINETTSLEDYHKKSRERAEKYAQTGTTVDKKEATNGVTQDKDILEALEKLNISMTALNKNVETLGGFIVRTVNKQLLDKSKSFKI